MGDVGRWTARWDPTRGVTRRIISILRARRASIARASRRRRDARRFRFDRRDTAARADVISVDSGLCLRIWGVSRVVTRQWSGFSLELSTLAARGDDGSHKWGGDDADDDDVFERDD